MIIETWSIDKWVMYVIFLYQVSQIFQDKELCIVNGPPSHSKSLLEKKVAEVFLVSLFCSVYVSWKR